MEFDQAHEQYSIRTALHACLDAGADPELMQQLVDLFRHRWMDNPEMRRYVDDMEVRYITLL
ncbi:hypothetical protein PSTEL_00460 [Paenibacillus stellifer]|uniref:Uncharacterized protein n=1 Tax=Paenibacillus stellifer TaxID=169760 RepID=A0A089LLR0_9BACL|nr:hypothetical protein PSTEL_00460 [Paenibacillus stellifer]